MDADMMDSESPPPPPPPPPSQPPFNIDQVDGVRGLLAFARQLIDQGKPSQALQAVVMAMRAKGGEEAVYQALSRARDSYRNKIQASSAADQLASLFAECAIAEALPSSTPEPTQSTMMMQESFEPHEHGTSILAETGRTQIMMDAFSDGSSFVCLQCGGLVSNHRRDEHYAFWCATADVSVIQPPWFNVYTPGSSS